MMMCMMWMYDDVWYVCMICMYVAKSYVRFKSTGWRLQATNCCYLTVEINTYERQSLILAQFTTFDIGFCNVDLDSRSSYKVIITSSVWASIWYQFCVSTSELRKIC